MTKSANDVVPDASPKCFRRILVVPNMKDEELCSKLCEEHNTHAYIELALSKLLTYRDELEEIVFVKTKYWKAAKHEAQLRHLILFCEQQHKKITVVDDKDEG